MAFVDQNKDEVSKKNIEKRYRNTLKSTYRRTINFDNSMSYSDINTIIESLHKHIPNGHEITFQFADGTYNLTDNILIQGFYGGGGINVLGNASDFNLGTTKAVFLDFSSGHGLFFSNNSVYLNIKGLKIRTITTSDNRMIYFLRCIKTCLPFFNYFLGTSITNGHGVSVQNNSFSYIQSNYFSNMKYAISAINNSSLVSNNNNSTGTSPAYGLYSQSSQIYKVSSQPVGSTANELMANGGIIG